MSHTDRHRPVWVQKADPEERAFYWRQVYANRMPEKLFIFRTCSCRWHSMYHWRKAEHRTRRRTEREAAIKILKGNLDAFDER